MNKTHPPTEVDLLIGRIVVSEEFNRRGWVGIAVPDSLGRQRLIGIYNGVELRRYVSTLIETHGESIREAIATYHPPKNHQIFFVEGHEASSKTEVRGLILQHLGPKEPREP